MRANVTFSEGISTFESISMHDGHVLRKEIRVNVQVAERAMPDPVRLLRVVDVLEVPETLRRRVCHVLVVFVARFDGQRIEQRIFGVAVVLLVFDVARDIVLDENTAVFFHGRRVQRRIAFGERHDVNDAGAVLVLVTRHCC